MGRPIEESLPFFTHDSDARRDRKAKLFISETGFAGWGFYWSVLEDAYNNKYYLPWSEEDQYMYVAEFNCSRFPIEFDDVSYLIERACRWKLIDRELYEEFQILTSGAMQRRWLKASSRRLLAKMRDDFVLINLPEFYEKELKTSNLSIKILDKNGETKHIYGDYKEDDSGNEVSVNNKEDDAEESVDNSPEYEEKYNFNRDYLWDGSQPIDCQGCIETWNKITGGQAWTKNIPKSKKKDLKRVFRNYKGSDVYYGMIARAQDERMKDSKYLTDWSTLFGAKKLENLDKWVDRGREWIQTQQSIETPEEHLQNGWMTQKQYKETCEKAGIDFEDPMFCTTKRVDSQLLYYPEFSH